MKLVFFDTETTGLKDPNVIQLAYTLFDSRGKSEIQPYIFNKYYKPPKPVEEQAIAVHGITNEELERHFPFMPSDIQSILENYIPVGHNAIFDINVLSSEGVTFPKWYICTMKIAREYYKNIENYRLHTLREYFDIEGDYNEHDASGDIQITKKVFFAMFDDVLLKMLPMEVTPEILDQKKKELLVKMINISINPQLLDKFPFGKHLGKSFEWIAMYHLDYLQYIKMKMFGELQPDLEFTINYYLEHYGK